MIKAVIAAATMVALAPAAILATASPAAAISADLAKKCRIWPSARTRRLSHQKQGLRAGRN